MARIQLTEAQEEQIRSMSKDGTKNKDIIEFFQKTYKITLGSSRISYVLYGREGKKSMGGGVATKAIRKTEQKRLVKKHTTAVQDSDEVDVKELVALLQQIDAGYKALVSYFKGILGNLRSELVKSRAEVRGMMKNADIEIPPEMED